MTQTAGRHPTLVDPALLFLRHREPLAVAGTTYYHNVVIALDSQGRGAKATGAPGLKVVGFYDGETFTAVATDRVSIANGVIPMVNSSTDPVTIADLKQVVYLESDDTIARTDAGGTLSPAGILELFEDSTPKVQIGGIPPAIAARAGASAIGLSLFDFREVTSGGDVGAITANGGILASDTSPIMRADAAESHEISWAAGNSDIISTQVTLPPDFDGTAPVYVDLWVYTDNTGGGGIEAATFTVETSWDAGALVTDTATDSTPATTGHKITATIAAADIPDAPSFLTMHLTPGTHANDPVQLLAARISYRRKA